ncbi:MAG: hemerythrin domain-containing protein [Burkholderiales bacterium]|nr:hemerythrin domain-containing protein [Burkholderiales bacterium]
MGKAIDAGTFDVLDECHRQILVNLAKLKALAQRLTENGIDDQVRADALAVEAFFSSTSRQHHAEEEAKVFPALLASGNAELVSTVRGLQQDHGWIEENWVELGPRLKAVASGNDWVEEAELMNYIDVFLELCRDHVAVEETLIYPESRARWAKAAAERV